MTIKKNDIVASRGRIKTLQEDRQRYISFDEALVLDVGDIGVSVNPLGMRAIVICKPDDLFEQGEISAEGYSRSAPKESPEDAEAVKQIIEREKAEHPEGSIAVKGEAAEEAKAKPTEGIAATRKRRRS